MFSSVEIREVMWIFRLLGSVPVLLLAFWLGRLWERWRESAGVNRRLENLESEVAKG